MSDPEHPSSELEVLLRVQGHDTALDVLHHRREAIPARAALADRLAEGARLYSALGDLRSRRDAVLAEEKRFDDEARSLTAKAVEVEGHLYSGSIASPRELQALQADLEQIKRLRSSLEDRELEVMEQRESLDAEVVGAEKAVLEAAGDVERLQTEIAAAEAVIDAEIATEAEERARLAATLSDPLTDDYETRRARNRGVGAARLIGNTCQGCRLSIPATEVDRIRRASGDGRAYCDNCGAILVPA